MDLTNFRKALDSVNWEMVSNKKDLNSQVVTLNETILNIFRNYVPNKYITIDDKDPARMNEIIKSKMEKSKQAGWFESDLVFIESLIAELNDLISYTKDLYYENLSKNLNNSLLQAKTYWLIIKPFYKKSSLNSTTLDRWSIYHWHTDKNKHF